MAITVARQAPDKAPMRQLESILTVHIEIPDVEFWIVGDGSEMPKMIKFIEDNQMGDYVKLLGSQTNPFKFMKRSDFYLSVSTKEGFNTACQEAAILGLPVISTDVDGAAELIEMTGVGEVIPNSKEGIVEALPRIFNDDIKLKSWIDRAKKISPELLKADRKRRIEEILLKFAH